MFNQKVDRVKSFFISGLGMLRTTSVIYSQSVQVWTENFDGNISFTAAPFSAWERDSNCTVSSSYAYLGSVPNMIREKTIIVSINNPSIEKDRVGQTIYVTTTLYNSSDYEVYSKTIEAKQGMNTLKLKTAALCCRNLFLFHRIQKSMCHKIYDY
jgi:hypothetical protein